MLLQVSLINTKPTNLFKLLKVLLICNMFNGHDLFSTSLTQVTLVAGDNKEWFSESVHATSRKLKAQRRERSLPVWYATHCYPYALSVNFWWLTEWIIEARNPCRYSFMQTDINSPSHSIFMSVRLENKLTDTAIETPPSLLLMRPYLYILYYWWHETGQFSHVSANNRIL